MESRKLRLAGFPDLKPSSRTISIRLPESLIESIKILAHKKDVPYQSMLKMLLAEAVREELVTSRKRVAARQ
jgi:predicted DNA binding CopG/RHH family protein